MPTVAILFAAMLLLLCYLLACAPLFAAQPPNQAAAPAQVPSNETTPNVAPAEAPANAVATTEQAALLALRAGWEDPDGHLANWTSASTGAAVCSWWGVTCTNSSVTSLFLFDLSLSGTLSAAIANLSSLSILNLSHNKLSGLIPPELGSLHSLTSVNLGHNSFNGSIPDALFSSSSLQILLLESNDLSGDVPPTIANLGSLRYLSLQSNTLTGPILAAITNLTRLSAIYAGQNKFNGTIPSQIGNLSRLVHLDLGENLFTGSIPASIGSLTQLTSLELKDNQLDGPLPAELGNLHEAIVMNLSHNSFSGAIPPELGRLSYLQILDLCQNDLEGSIPASIGNMSMLKSLNLSFNNLSGEVPINGVLASFNFTSYVGNGLLCGGPLLDSSCERRPEHMKHMNKTYQEGGTSQLGKNGKVTIIVVAGAFGLVVIFVILVFCCCGRRREEANMERSVERARNSFSIDIADSMRKAKMEIYMEDFPHNYEVIVSHAGYFDTAHVLGKGRFATVYRSDLPGGRHLAVKVFNNPITQSVFEREVAKLHESASHVTTLLPIRGYYSNPIEKAILYDFMPRGTLYDVLHKSPTLLDWSKRINIALGVAQALSHLHRGSVSRILHKDLKSSNVLLDDDLNPRVADYGHIDLVSKTVVETLGYTPPEFTSLSYSVRRYSEKTDVYSFGILLLELLTGKRPVSPMVEESHVSNDDDNKTSSIPHQDEEEKISSSHQDEESCVSQEEKSHVSNEEEEFGTKVHLVTWVLGLHKEGQDLEVFSPFVVQSCPSLDHQVQAFNLALLCIDDEPAQRPSMPEIISILERLLSNASPMRDNDQQSKRPLLK